MDSLLEALIQVDWDGLDHAYGRASDAPGQVLALIGDDPQAQSGAVGYLDAVMLHQGSVYSATGPFVRFVAAVLADPATDAVVEDVLPWDAEPRPLRAALLEYLALFAEACRLEVSDEELLSDAYPVGRDEADLQRIREAARACEWTLDPDPDTRTPPPAALMEAVNDTEYRKAMEARDLLACRQVVPDVYAAVLPLITASEPTVRTPAMTAAAYCLDHAALSDSAAALIELITDTAAISSDPRERATIARLLAILGELPEPLLNDPHPGVRACAALAPGCADDPRATSALVTALENPHEADHWFDRHLPGQEGWLHFDLARALAERADDLETILPAALGLATLSFTLNYDNDLAPFVDLAFPEPLTDHTVLTPAQRTFLGALLDHRHLPFNEALCRRLLGG
ncbi:hypothetical protein [Nonomuraea sp. NEAU-A123]|uniref:hypothetical protein n=1 Tax=Nonomuraea sp. NEAU-A123 TaxID=2839649 RepID=UPI001BE4C51B|nr:hypothetical protein [Nonomuraea sp. NEAU-A123]MBT2229394.1 hypothetical protein [Nonomuraea sp. NEAU-A123]